jgi:membrane-associated phospholipid phosphatase
MSNFMSGYAATVSRRLPRGWAHLGLQFAIWMGFYGAYQVARGYADHAVYTAFQNGRWIIDFQRNLGALFEPGLQRVVEGSTLLIDLTAFTYWLSQFAVVGLALLWTYFRRHQAFFRFRNALIAANLIGLALYVLVPTAPPRMFPDAGFHDTLAAHSSVNHESVAGLANPYAAMPSLHAMDALIVGIVVAALVRSRWAKAAWLAWPPWVWFAVMSTGNHYWLDVVAGVLIAGAAGAVVYRDSLRRRLLTRGA